MAKAESDASPSEPPRWAATSWGLNPGTRVASDAGLSTARIVQAAIELADEDGLAALSIRKLGQRLGAGTMAAYRHIDSRDDLVILMVDVALGPPDAGIVAAPTWQLGLTRWAEAISDRYRAHPWLIDAAISGFPTARNRALWLEYVLEVLEATGLGMQDMLDTALLIDGHARNTAYLARELARAASAGGFGPIDWVVPLIDPATFPMLSKVMTTGELEDETEQTMDFGLARIIAGLESLI